MASTTHFTADSLKRNGGSDLVKSESLEIYRAVKTKIHEVRKFKNSIEFDMPMVFNVEGFELKDVQLLVYTDVIVMLERDNFTVSIDIGPSVTKLYVKWSAGLDDEERERRKKILTAHLYKPRGA